MTGTEVTLTGPNARGQTSWNDQVGDSSAPRTHENGGWSTHRNSGVLAAGGEGGLASINRAKARKRQLLC